jgi:hypothetical protein
LAAALKIKAMAIEIAALRTNLIRIVMLLEEFSRKIQQEQFTPEA